MREGREDSPARVVSLTGLHVGDVPMNGEMTFEPGKTPSVTMRPSEGALTAEHAREAAVTPPGDAPLTDADVEELARLYWTVECAPPWEEAMAGDRIIYASKVLHALAGAEGYDEELIRAAAALLRRERARTAGRSIAVRVDSFETRTTDKPHPLTGRMPDKPGPNVSTLVVTAIESVDSAFVRALLRDPACTLVLGGEVTAAPATLAITREEARALLVDYDDSASSVAERLRAFLAASGG